MVVSGGMTAIFIIAILSQFVVCTNKPTKKLQVHETPHTPEIHLDCKNETLSPIYFELYPNGTVFVIKYGLFLDSPSSYVYNNDTLTICRPPVVVELDRFTVGFYFAFVIFMTHAQTPIVMCFGSMSRLFLTFVCCMPMATLFSTFVSSSISDFFDECKVTVAMLTFINVSTLGWMTFLSSEYMLRLLESRDCIEITEHKIILKKLSSVAHVGILIGAVLSIHTFVMIFYGSIKNLYGVELIDRIDGDSMLIMFGSPILFFLTINIMVCLATWNYTKVKGGMREEIRLQHRKYFLCYVGSVFLWVFGSFALSYKSCMPWYCFVFINVMLPMYWLNEFFTVKFFSYDIPDDYRKDDGGYTVLFKLNKKVVKLDFDYNSIQNAN